MKRIISIFIAVAMLLQISFVVAQASSEYLVIEDIDFDSDVNLTAITSDVADTRLEEVKVDFGYSYILDSGASVQIDRKSSAYNSGKLVLEMDFLANNTNSGYVYRLVHLQSRDSSGVAQNAVDCIISGGNCGNVKINANQWYHLRYELDVDNKKSVYYIDGVQAGSNNSLNITNNYSLWRITVMSGEGAELCIDNMKVSKLTNRASIQTVNYYTGNQVQLNEDSVTDDMFFAEVNFDRNIDFNSVKDDNVVLYEDGARKSGGYYLLPDQADPTKLTVYFDGDFEPTAKYKMDFSNLVDEWGLTLMENSMVEFEMESSYYKNAVYKMYDYSGTEITDVNTISDGDKVRLALTFDPKFEEASNLCILAFAVYGEDGKMKDVITEIRDVASYINEVSLSTDFMTINNPDGEKLYYKGFLWNRENLSPQVERFILEKQEIEQVGTLSPDFSAFDEFVEDEIVSPSKYFNRYADVKEQFADTVCFVVDCPNIYGGGKKYTMTAKPVYENGEIWVPASVMTNIFGRSFSGTKTIDGTVCVSLEKAASEMSLYYSKSYKGLGVISDRPVNVEASINIPDVKKIIRYIAFDRPSSETLKAALSGRSNPRAIVPESTFTAIKNSTDKKVQLMSHSILNESATLLAQETPIETPTVGATYGADYNSIMKLYWIYSITGDTAYADKAIEHAMRMANWDHWMDTYYFLGTSYNLLTCGYVYDLFQDELSVEQKTTLQQAIFEKGLNPAREHYYGKGESDWPLRNTNWNVVCNTGAIVAALAICNDYESDICFDILEKALVSLEYALLEYAPDGGWFEGAGYSLYTANYLVLAFQALDTAFDTNFGLVNAPGLLKYGYYPFYMSATEDKVNLGDEVRGNGNTLSAPASLWIANYTRDTVLQSMRMNQMKVVSGGTPTFLDLLWYMPGEEELHIDAPLDRNYSYTEMAMSRSGWEGDATFLSVHAGENSCAHGQMDIGQFELEVKGTRFALDMGRDNYNLPNYFYFGSTREEYYVNRAEGHNVYVINPDESKGQYYYAVSTVETVSEKPDGVIYTVDMTPAYVGQLKKAKRGYMLTDNRRVFVMQDEIKPKKSGDEYYWFWHTDATITIDQNDNSHVTLTKNGIDLDLYFKSNVDFTVTSGESVPLPTSPDGEGDQLTTYGTVNKITVRFTSGNSDIKLRVTAVPDDVSYDENTALTAISDWRIADGIRSDRYTIGDGVISNIPVGTETADFLSHIYTGRATKSLVLDGIEYTDEHLSGDIVLEVTQDNEIESYSLQYVTKQYTTAIDTQLDNFTTTLYATQTGSQVIGKYNMLAYFSNIDGNEAYIEGVASAETGGNAAHVVSTANTANRTFIQMQTGDCTLSNEGALISFDFKRDTQNGSFEVQGKFDGSQHQFIKFNSNGTITAFGKVIAGYEPSEWNKVQIYLEPGLSNLYRIYINGKIVDKGDATWLRNVGVMTQLKLVADSESAGTAMSLWFDNVKVEKY